MPMVSAIPVALPTALTKMPNGVTHGNGTMRSKVESDEASLESSTNEDKTSRVDVSKTTESSDTNTLAVIPDHFPPFPPHFLDFLKQMRAEKALKMEPSKMSESKPVSSSHAAPALQPLQQMAEEEKVVSVNVGKRKRGSQSSDEQQTSSTQQQHHKKPRVGPYHHVVPMDKSKFGQQYPRLDEPFQEGVTSNIPSHLDKLTADPYTAGQQAYEAAISALNAQKDGHTTSLNGTKDDLQDAAAAFHAQLFQLLLHRQRPSIASSLDTLSSNGSFGKGVIDELLELSAPNLSSFLTAPPPPPAPTTTHPTATTTTAVSINVAVEMKRAKSVTPDVPSVTPGMQLESTEPTSLKRRLTISGLKDVKERDASLPPPEKPVVISLRRTSTADSAMVPSQPKKAFTVPAPEVAPSSPAEPPKPPKPAPPPVAAPKIKLRLSLSNLSAPQSRERESTPGSKSEKGKQVQERSPIGSPKTNVQVTKADRGKDKEDQGREKTKDGREKGRDKDGEKERDRERDKDGEKEHKKQKKDKKDKKDKESRKCKEEKKDKESKKEKKREKSKLGDLESLIATLSSIPEGSSTLSPSIPQSLSPLAVNSSSHGKGQNGVRSAEKSMISPMDNILPSIPSSSSHPDLRPQQTLQQQIPSSLPGHHQNAPEDIINSWGRNGATQQANPGANPPPRTGMPGAAGRIGAAVPGTARGVPPGTAFRPGTGMRGMGGGFGLQVVDRPMTQQGLGGVKMTSQGPGRVVQDKTYFQAELRQKINLLWGEIAKLNNEAEQIQKENSNYSTFERRADALAEELKDLQGQLGDLNTLVDKLHTDADLEDLERACEQSKAKKQRQSQVLDEVFALRQQKDNLVRELERTIEAERQKAEAHINELPPAKRSQYLKWKEENQSLQTETETQQAEHARLLRSLNEIQAELRQDNLKQRAMVLHEKLSQAKSTKQELEDALKALELEPGPQERAQLLEKVRQHNVYRNWQRFIVTRNSIISTLITSASLKIKKDGQEVSTMERQISELEDKSRRLKDQLAHLETETEPQQHSEKNAKYEELVKRDKDMQAFIDVFDDKKRDAVERNTATERNIVALLEKIQALAKADQSSLHGKRRDSKVGSGKDLKSSENSFESLVQERDRRMQDLEKVTQLETKIQTELKALKEKSANLTSDLKKVANIAEVKKDVESSKKKNAADREVLRNQRDTLRQLVSMLSSKYDAKRSQLGENETYSQLTNLEQRLRQHEETNFSLKDFINAKSAESDYKPVAADVASLVVEINQQLIKLMSMPPAR
ncbi:Intraflagellar transport protein 74 [Quaeritorhiza haematococci]|nr:Intraflagellar transport protein 74 [Quaeritorhiza haematococci]